MFELESAIRNWRQQMAHGGISCEDVLDELENHLREEFARRLREGADGQSAFTAATEVLGPVDLLRGEFLKLGTKPHARAWFRLLFRILPAAMLAVNIWTLLAYDLSLWERSVGILAVATIYFCLFRFSKSSAPFPAVGLGRFASVFKLANTLAVLWPLFALLEAINIIHLPIGFVAVTVIWSLYAAFALAACWNVLLSRRQGGSNGGPGQMFGPQSQPVPPDPPATPQFAAAWPPERSTPPVVQELLQMAAEEARQLGHDFVGTEHVLLGLLQLGQGSRLLERLSLNSTSVRNEIARLVAPLPVTSAPSRYPLTPRAGKAVKLAAREARRLKHPSIAPEHLFLGLLLEGGGVAALVLKRLGVRTQRARQEVLNDLQTQPG